eukprot:scaffold213_cov245-Pinguiococcus_pyrenoidosus.AAC.49
MGVLPESLEQTEDGDITVKTAKGDLTGFNTVLSAIGRAPDTPALGVTDLGVELKPNGKINSLHEQTNVPNVYAIGDCTFDSYLELTPVAIQAGELLAERLYRGTPSSGPYMDYTNVATTVFTPLEYGSCGMTEEEAQMKLGEDLEVLKRSASRPFPSSPLLSFWFGMEITSSPQLLVAVGLPQGLHASRVHRRGAPRWAAAELLQGAGGEVHGQGGRHALLWPACRRGDPGLRRRTQVRHDLRLSAHDGGHSPDELRGIHHHPRDQE